MDQSALQEVQRELLNQPDVLDVRRVRARRMGHYIVADAEVGVHPTVSVSSAEEVIRRARIRVREALPFVSEILLRVYPAYLERMGATESRHTGGAEREETGKGEERSAETRQSTRAQAELEVSKSRRE